MSKTALSLAARRSADSHPRCAGPLLSALRRPYSNKNRMKSVSWVVSSVTQTQGYSINALGQRLKKTKTAGTAPQATVHFTYDEAGRLTGEYNANNQLVQEVLWLDDMPLATLRPRAGQTLQTIGATGQLSGSTVQVIDAFHIHADHLNTPRVITRPSDNKKVWEWVNSEPFGNNAPNENPQAVGAFTFNLAFPGQYRDKETGLSYNYFRDYNPQTGRYVQSDPIGLRGGINMFGYVGGDPMRYVDPRGLFAPGIHAQITIDAIVRAGATCPNLVLDVVMADFTRGSQAPANARFHGMRPPDRDRSLDDAIYDFHGFIKEQMRTCTCVGLARALHAAQDAFAGGHTGLQVWGGGVPSLSHMGRDNYPAPDERNGAVDVSVGLIKQFKDRCACF